MPSRKQNPKSRTEKVHAALRQAILEQRLTAGARLPEDAIGESFGTSRTIAREALGRLAVEGLVDLIPNRGAFVAKPSLDEGREIFAVRKGLERMVMLHLAEQMTPKIAETLQNMVQIEADMVARNEAEAIRLAGEFHLRLAEMTGNALLSRYVTEVASRCSLVLAMYGRPHSADCAASEHQALVAALLDRDGPKAAELMENHLDAVAGRALIGRPATEDVRSVLAAFAQQIDRK